MEKKEKEEKEVVFPVPSVPSVPSVLPEVFDLPKKTEGNKGNKGNNENREQYLLSSELGFLQGKNERLRYAILLYDHQEGLSNQEAGELLNLKPDIIKQYGYRLNEKATWLQNVGLSNPQRVTLSSVGRAEIQKMYFDYQRSIAEQKRKTIEVQEATLKYEQVMDLPQQIEKFMEFFTINEQYLVHLQEQVINGHAWVNLDFADLARYSPELAELLLDLPDDVLRSCQIGIEKLNIPSSNDKILPRMEIRVTNLPSTVRMSSLGPEHIMHLVQVEAQVLTVSERRPMVTSARFECPSCGNIIPVIQNEQKFREPTRCSCGRKGKFHELKEARELVAACTLLLVQPLTEMVGKKVRPSQLKVFLKNDLTRDDIRDHLGLNSMVQVVGVLHEIPIILPSGGQSTRFDVLLEAKSVHLLDHYNPQLSLSPERVQQIKDDVAHSDFKERMVQSMFPRHIGDDTLKEQLLCMSVALPLHLNSPEAKRQAECEAINAIVAGDPGMGKSNLGRRMQEFCPHSGRATGAGATKAGLTIAADSKDKENDLVIPCPGAMPNANMGIFILDELDKMELTEQTVLNEALSDHTVTITKRGVNTTLPANICFVGFANPRVKNWDLSKATIENELNIHYTLLTRCIVNIQTDVANANKDTAIATSVLNKDQAVLTSFDDDYIQDYILYARGTVHPKLRDQDKESIVKVYVQLRKELRGKFLSPRFVEQMRSLTLLHAKVFLRQETRAIDVDFARQTLRNALIAGGFETLALNVKEEKIAAPSGLSDWMNWLDQQPNGIAEVDTLIAQFPLIDYQALRVNGEVFEPRPGFVRRLI